MTMATLFEYQKTFTVEDCEMNPDKLYVFGDNLQRYGKGGQAIIRDCTNSVGVATKRQPSVNSHAYLTAVYHADTLEAIDDISNVLKTFFSGNYNSIVLPADGLGTGRAKLQENNPKLLHLLNGVFYKTEEEK